MCGICGIVNANQPDVGEQVRRMTDKMIHRGPDGGSIFSTNHTALGHRRLAIVDAANQQAQQPMENEKYVLSFNGEIYNHDKLRTELEKRGVRFRTNCDTEVLLEGYTTLGDEILEKLNGQFAFAMYDKSTGDTLLARDRTAMKPLYFSIDGRELQFSSTPNAIADNIGYELNLDSITSLLINGTAFAAGEEPLGSSIYGGIDSVKPGEIIRVSADGSVARSKYFSLPIRDIVDQKSVDEHVTQLRKVVESSIKQRIPEEVSLGCALSGGLDSSIITAITADNYEGEVVASCIRYTADKHNPDYEAAKILAASRRNIRLVTADISPENFLDDLEDIVAALGIHDSIRQIGMYRNFKTLKAQNAKVVLTGEGADEFNWGYWHKFPGLKNDQEACSTEESFRKLVAQREGYVKQLINKSRWGEIDFEVGINHLLDIYRSFETSDSTRKMMGVYAVDFLGFLNKANDRLGMAHSIEVRCPFQDDVEVIETCLGIPREYQVRDGTEKKVLRDAFKDVLPPEIYSREKFPLPAASNIEYHKAIAQKFKERLGAVHTSFWDYFNRETFEKISTNYNLRINELEQNGSESGAALVAWRSISGSCDIINGKDIRTNDVFKLLTTMIWYDQNRRKID